jgi:integrase
MPKKDEAAGAQGHTSNGRGTLLLERKFGTVQIRRASGTKSPDELAAIVELLDALTSTGRLDIVRRVQQGGIRAVELLRRQRAGLGIDLPNLDPVALDRLDVVGPRWLASRKGASEGHARNCRLHLKVVTKRWPTLTLDGLPGVLVTLRQEYEGKNHAVTFNQIRTSLLDLARWVGGGKRTALWTELQSVPKLRASISVQRAHNPLDVHTAVQLSNLLNQVAPGAGDAFMTLCTTGLRPSEYWGKRWQVLSDYSRISIRGTKSKAAVRSIPLVMLGSGPVAPTISYGRYSKMFRETIREYLRVKPEEPLPWTLYDCRRTFAVWMEEAGIPRTRRRLYLGHAKADVTDTYEERNSKGLDKAFQTDSETLTSYLLREWRSFRDRTETEGAKMKPQTAPQTPIRWDEDLLVKAS